MERFYIYKLTFRNGCTYIGKHHQKRDFDTYITSSAYYNKHKDLLEKREIILDVKDIETLDIMETICILGDIAENRLNVNYNYGAWINNSKFDRGFCGAANGMYGKSQSELARIKMKAKWTKERKEKASKIRSDYNRTPEWKEKMKDLNSSEEHKRKCSETRRKNINEKQRYICIKEPTLVIDFSTWNDKLQRDGRFVRTEDFTPISGDIESWIKINKTGHGQASKGKHWYNNGIIETYAFECPDGFEKGRLKFSKEAISNMKLAQQKVHSRPDYYEKHSKPAWNKGMPMSEAQKEKMRHKIKDTETGQVFSCIDDLLEKMSISKCKYYKDKKNGKYTNC